MEPTKETLGAFVDGELSPAEATRIEALLASRPDLKAYVERQQALRQSFAQAFRGVLDEPVPERLRSAAASAPVSWQARLSRFPRKPPLWWAGAPAAALACGIVIGVVLMRPSVGDNPFAVSRSSGQLIAQGALAHALTSELASAGAASGSTRIGVSFHSRDGQDCRTFELGGASSTTAGLACSDKSEWVIVATAAEGASGTSSYRPAAGMPQSIRALISRMIQGEPFDAAAERAARDRGWRH